MKILFQGDSITDAGRDRADVHNLGHGYPFYAAELIKEKYPDVEFEFINQGISGNRAENLLARWETDAIEHNPDIISILIAVLIIFMHRSNIKRLYEGKENKLSLKRHKEATKDSSAEQKQGEEK